MKIALCQINTTVGDFDGNVAKIGDFLGRAKAAHCGLAVFPELTLTGYPPRDLLERPGFLQKAAQALQAVAEKSRGIAALVGTVVPNPGTGNPLFNAAVLVMDGKILETRHKTLLPNYDVFDEDRYFEPAREAQEPLALGGLRIGVTICEDIWNNPAGLTRKLYDLDPVTDLAARKCDLVVNLSASPFHLAKSEVREEVVRQAARKLKCPILLCNLVGGNDELVFDGSSLALDANGRLGARAKDFEEDLLVVEAPNPSATVAPASGETEALYRALVLGTRDYVTKCGFQQVLIGLSGGIDSALVAALAAEALGPDNVLGVTMPSPFSSKGSVDDSAALAKALGIRFENIPLTPLYEQSLASLKPSFAGKAPDLTEENLQARLRGLILMALSNKFNRLVLSTGNKSELSMGYCTLYGDMCGGLAVISDLLKTQVYELARHANRNGVVIPEAVFTKAPSAELRPDQKDQDSLPPYKTLDGILRRHLERNKTAAEITSEGFDAETVRWVLKTLDLSEYKRRQMAPGIKVTPKAFGVGRRIPIAQKYKES